MANTRSLAPAPAHDRRPAVPSGAWSPSLFSLGDPEPDPTFTSLVRHHLDGRAWVDHAPGWLAGSGDLFERLVARLDWSARRVTMYDRLVDEPRLTAGWPGASTDPVAGPVVEQIRGLLSVRYHRDLASTWANLYRDGRDSVAWHGDRILRDQDESLVAIVSLGEERPFRLRPRGGGSSIRFDLGQGDLLVMGGTCQRTWQHAVPKVRRAGPRLSLSFREHRPVVADLAPAQSAVARPIGQDTPVPPSPQ
jgi:alkylated DNA repair dioxygenase AlkB